MKKILTILLLMLSITIHGSEHQKNVSFGCRFPQNTTTSNQHLQNQRKCALVTYWLRRAGPDVTGMLIGVIATGALDVVKIGYDYFSKQSETT